MGFKANHRGLALKRQNAGLKPLAGARATGTGHKKWPQPDYSDLS